jgi:hypothetical protein
MIGVRLTVSAHPEHNSTAADSKTDTAPPRHAKLVDFAFAAGRAGFAFFAFFAGRAGFAFFATLTSHHLSVYSTKTTGP